MSTNGAWLPEGIASQVPSLVGLTGLAEWHRHTAAALMAFSELVQLQMPKSLTDSEFRSRPSPGRPGEAPGTAHVHKSAHIHPGTQLLGDVLVSANCELGPNAVVFGPTILGPGVYLGPNAEVRRSVLFEEVLASHACYIGHSIVGRRANIAANFVTAVRNMKRDSVHVILDGALHDSGFTLFGAMIADDVEFGCGVTIMPGRMVLDAKIVSNGAVVYRNC